MQRVRAYTRLLHLAAGVEDPHHLEGVLDDLPLQPYRLTGRRSRRQQFPEEELQDEGRREAGEVLSADARKLARYSDLIEEGRRPGGIAGYLEEGVEDPAKTVPRGPSSILRPGPPPPPASPPPPGSSC